MAKTTTTTETGEMSARGKMYDDLFRQLILGQLDEAGYDITFESKTEYKDPAKAEALQNKISQLNDRITKLDKQPQRVPPPGYILQGNFYISPTTGDKIPLVSTEQERGNLQAEVDKVQKDLDKIEKTTYETPIVTKRPDPMEAQNKQFEAQKRQLEISRMESMADVETSYLKNLKKLVSGDWSYTQEQKEQNDKYFSPIRDIITQTADQLLSKNEGNIAALRSDLNNLALEIDRSGFKIMDALKAAELQIDQQGGDLLSTLKRVNESSAARFKFQQDLLFREIDEKADQQAAFLGLPPQTPAFAFQKARMKNEVIKGLELELNQREAEGELGIKSAIGEQKRGISLARVALEETQGGKREALAKARFGVTEAAGNREFEILGTRGNALLQLEQAKQNQLAQMAVGGLPGQISAAQSGLGFDINRQAAEQASQAAGQNLFASRLAPVTGQLGMEQQRQFAETTTTQKTKPGFWDVLTNIAGIGTGIAAVAQTGGQPAPFAFGGGQTAPLGGSNFQMAPLGTTAQASPYSFKWS